MKTIFIFLLLSSAVIASEIKDDTCQVDVQVGSLPNGQIAFISNGGLKYLTRKGYVTHYSSERKGMLLAWYQKRAGNNELETYAKLVRYTNDSDEYETLYEKSMIGQKFDIGDVLKTFPVCSTPNGFGGTIKSKRVIYAPSCDVAVNDSTLTIHYQNNKKVHKQLPKRILNEITKRGYNIYSGKVRDPRLDFELDWQERCFHIGRKRMCYTYSTLKKVLANGKSGRFHAEMEGRKILFPSVKFDVIVEHLPYCVEI